MTKSTAKSVRAAARRAARALEFAAAVEKNPKTRERLKRAYREAVDAIELAGAELARAGEEQAR